jgi:ribonuclease P protein component
MEDFSFEKRHRLLSASDFKYLRSGSKQLKDRTLRIYCRPGRLNQSETRLGLSVSKKVGSAVVRNRTKRILRETFRQKGHRELGLDIMVVVSPYLYKNFPNGSKGEVQLKLAFEKKMKELSKRNDS